MTGIALLIISIGALRGGIVKVIFFPDLDDDFIEARFLLEPGAPEQQVVNFATKVESAAEQIKAELNANQSTSEPVIRKVLTNIGGEQSEAGVVQLELLPGEQRDAAAASISQVWRKAIGPTPETRYLLVGPRSRGPFGKPIDVELLSTNSADLEAAAAELSEALRAYPGVYDISDDLAIGKRELVITLTDRGRAAGLTLGTVATQIRRGLFGSRAEVLQRGREELEVWVRFSRDARESVSQLAELRLKTQSGEEIPLQEAATWEAGRGLSTIKRYQRRRRVKVTAAIETSVANPQDVVTEVQNTVVPSVTSNYDNMSYSFEGQSRSRRKMMEGFTAAVPWALLGMLAILVVVFGSLLQGILVLLMIPLGIAGAIAGHYIVGIPLTVLSMWGIVALGGILVNDSIVFVDSINRRLRDGKDLLTAIHEAGISRFRPILLTTITTAAGLLPLILEQSRQAQFLIPMATSVAFGLIFGTIFTLGVLPAGFACINDLRRAAFWLRYGRWPSSERLEPVLNTTKK
jgi:multidrug efflux pump subunit AcrB